ncbi:MAG: esterase family protein, partial [Lachnospiraceae bacterium]|nr:esterase family protein [Lachnospiraceae bacterium]
DMKYGSPYFTYVAEELPRYMEKVFPITDNPGERFAAGLSMGGYGAMKLGLTFPERFAAVASMSGVLDVEGLMKKEELTREIELDQVLRWCYGDFVGAKAQENDLCSLLERAVERQMKLPRIFQCVGTEDFLYEINQTFLKKAKELEIDLAYEEEPGIHEWDYWEKKLFRVFEWMFSERKV